MKQPILSIGAARIAGSPVPNTHPVTHPSILPPKETQPPIKAKTEAEPQPAISEDENFFTYEAGRNVFWHAAQAFRAVFSQPEGLAGG